MSTQALKQFFIFHPPRRTGAPGGPVKNASVTTSANSTQLWTTGAGGDRPPGKVWVSFQPSGGSATIHFHSDATGAATALNGVTIADGGKESFWLDPSRDVYVHHIGSAALTLKYWVSSPPGEGRMVQGEENPT